VPADTRAGRDELEEINRIRVKHGEPPFGSVQEVVGTVRSDGHIPVVSAGELSSGVVA
jgi:hypothetical protein